MKQKTISTYDLCIMAVFTAIIVVMAQIVIPMPLGVPMTFQTLAIMITGVMLGAKKSVIVTIVYVLAGALGAPVFAGLAGGPGIVFGHTGGFIISFPLLALAAGIGSEKGSKLWLWSGLALGVIINYLCGTIFFSIYTSNDLITSFTACVLFFIPTDILKIVIAGLFGIKVKRFILQKA